MANVFYVFGPPGTGKTSRLATRDIPRAVQKYGTDNVVVAAFTRAAALEISQKKSRDTGRRIPVNPENVGTLHSLCFRGFKLTREDMMANKTKEWNSRYPQYAIARATADPEEDVEEASNGTPGDQLLGKLNICRARMLKRELWPPTVRRFNHLWEEFKQKHNAWDFSDLIEKAITDLPYAPGQPSVMFVDEAQDFTKLEIELVLSWAQMMEWVVMTGDDDQCQPPDTIIETVNGPKCIEQLNPEADRLLSYCRQDSCIYGSQKGGYRFQKASRFYYGNLFTVSCDGKSTSSTNNHKWLVKWSNIAKHPDRTAVYLMWRNGYGFRVGWCQLFRADGCFHLGTRARLEGADKTWILKVCDNKSDASMFESLYAAEYGIPTMLFNPVNNGNASHYTRKFLDIFWSRIHSEKNFNGGQRALNNHNREFQYPLWSPEFARAKRGGCSIFKCQSCNLLSGLMEIPSVVNGQRVEWKQIAVSVKNYAGQVYSLDVEKHHTYIADGLVTHNCIYRFKGADPENMRDPEGDPKRKVVLNQSWRVPRAVHARAMEVISRVRRREEKEYLPRDEEGEVYETSATMEDNKRIIEEASDHIRQGDSVMFLASCSYMLQPLIKEMSEHGIPFSNRYRKRRGDWNPIVTGGNRATAANVLSSFLTIGEDEGFWSVPDLILWASQLRVCETGLKRKTGNAAITKLKAAIKEGAEGLRSARNVLSLILDESAIEPAMNRDIDWLMGNIKPAKQKRLSYASKVLKGFGEDILHAPAICTVGTIHSVKGGEADVVYLSPDISIRAQEELKTSQEAIDAIHRLFYVGMTRAYRKLVLLGSTSRHPGGFVKL